MATAKQLKAAILARRASKGPRRKRTRPEPDALARATRAVTRLVSHCAAGAVVVPERDRLLPLTTRQFKRAVHAAAHMAEIKKWISGHRNPQQLPPAVAENKKQSRAVMEAVAAIHRNLSLCVPKSGPNVLMRRPADQAFKAELATVSFDAAKAGKLSRGFQDCEQIGSFEKSGVRAALGTPQGSKPASVEGPHGRARGSRGGAHLCPRSGGGT